MSPPVVEFRDVSKRFGAGSAVLDGITFRVAPGEFVALIGPSGCGKSTLLRLIAGLSPVSGGTLTVNGATPESAASQLGFVFQDPTLLPWLTVAGNIELPQKLRGVGAPARTQRRDELLRLVRLAEKAKAYPRQLSGGQKMRVSLARALALDPKILLLDEPFGALDEMTREHLNEELLAIHRATAWTAFFVTHSVAEAVFLSSRIIVLSANPGRVHADISVPLPAARNADTRLSKAYHELVDHVSRLLRAVEVSVA
jgi:NitT/TauT family transport system ATP-binding protein